MKLLYARVRKLITKYLMYLTNLKLLRNLRSLINFGASEIKKIKLDINRDSIKKLTLFSLIGVFHNYSEAALLLPKSKKTYAGEILLRSLLENFVTMHYILLDDR